MPGAVGLADQPHLIDVQLPWSPLADPKARPKPASRGGLEVQEHLSGISPETRVIVITGRDDPRAKLTAMKLGVIAFFTKPFDADQFLNAVRGALVMHSVK